MERVSESENKLGLPAKEQEQLIEVSGFGYDDIDMQTRLDRINADREHLLHNQAVLIEQLQKSRHEKALFEQRLAGADLSFKEATKSLNNERDFLRRQVADFKQREAQHQHEVRRLEMDNEALRDKLRSALSSGGSTKHVSTKLVESSSAKNLATATSTSSSGASASAASGPAQQRVDSTAQKNLKSRVDEVERENEQLRLLLNTLTDQVDSLLGSSSPTTTKRSGSTSSGSDLSALQTLIKRQMDDLRNASLQEKNYSQTEEVSVLKDQLESYQRLIEEQHKLLTLAITPEPNRLFEPTSNDS